MSHALPRLLYLGDAPVESSYHGSSMIHRLLEEYPAERLLVMEAAPLRSDPSRRLRGVTYRYFAPLASRGIRTRFAGIVHPWMLKRAASYRSLAERLLGDFEPEAVLTVSHGYSWLAAGEFAQRRNLPLHLLSHDSWMHTADVPLLRKWQEREFARLYSRAASRFCVSPGMEAAYREAYDAPGHVLFASWAKDCAAAREAPATWNKPSGPLVGAYAGTITQEGYACHIRELAALLEQRGGRLLLFGPHSEADVRRWGLDRPNVAPQGLLPAAQVLAQLQREADFVFVPVTFEPFDTVNVRVGFPSKIADYTATGLPLLIRGPEYCSAMEWARKYAPVAETGEPGAALDRLEDAGYREKLGRAARTVGEQLFSHDVCTGIFREALTRA